MRKDSAEIFLFSEHSYPASAYNNLLPRDMPEHPFGKTRGNSLLTIGILPPDFSHYTSVSPDGFLVYLCGAK